MEVVDLALLQQILDQAAATAGHTAGTLASTGGSLGDAAAQLVPSAAKQQAWPSAQR